MSSNNINVDHNESISNETTAICSDITSLSIRSESTRELTVATLAEASDQSEVRINVYENIPFAGGDGDYSILSVLFGAHSIGEGIFGFLNMIDSNKVRVQCVECRKAVMDFEWMDAESRIKGSVKAWRAAFPCARAVNVSQRRDIVDADFVHIRGDAHVRLHSVNINRCSNVSGSAFAHLRGIHTLDMSDCRQVTDAAFENLRGIHTFNISRCHQVTDAAFEYLQGTHTLNVSGCSQFTDVAFAHLHGIHTLTISGSRQFTDAAFWHLRGIHTLNMSDCERFTDAAFEHLRGIHTLCITGCDRLSDAAFEHFHGIHTLVMSNCDQDTITDAAFLHLRGIHTLYMNGCVQATITGAAMGPLLGISQLTNLNCHLDVRIAAAEMMHYYSAALKLEMCQAKTKHPFASVEIYEAERTRHFNSLKAQFEAKMKAENPAPEITTTTTTTRARATRSSRYHGRCCSRLLARIFRHASPDSANEGLSGARID